MTFYRVTPMAKPRMTRSDVWKKRDCVVRYRQFCDDLRASGATIESGDRLIFFIPMPASWSQKKRAAMDGMPHTSKPDLDNLLKAVMDALLKDDSGIHKLSCLEKVWSVNPGISIYREVQI